VLYAYAAEEEKNLTNFLKKLFIVTFARNSVDCPSIADSANCVQGCFSLVQNANGIAKIEIFFKRFLLLGVGFIL